MKNCDTSFVNCCTKMPVDPFSRQPTPIYERRPCNLPKTKAALTKSEKQKRKERLCNNYSEFQARRKDDVDAMVKPFFDFVKSIPDYSELRYLTNQQFKQRLDYIKRKQTELLEYLQYLELTSIDMDRVGKGGGRGAGGGTTPGCSSGSSNSARRNKESAIKLNGTFFKHQGKTKTCKRSENNGKSITDSDEKLKLKGKKCSISESRSQTRFVYPTSSFTATLKNDGDFMYGCRTMRNPMDNRRANNNRMMDHLMRLDEIFYNDSIATSDRSWSPHNSQDNKSTDGSNDPNCNILAETKSLPPPSPKKCNSTLPSAFILREKNAQRLELEHLEKKLEMRSLKKRGSEKRKHYKKVPLTSTLPLYDKLLAEKEERSRIVREESALNLLSQVRPFKLECDGRSRAWKCLMSRSSPELSGRRSAFGTSSSFKATPIPKHLFNPPMCQRILQDEYFRQLRKEIRAMELLRSSSLPPSMAKRQRAKSASIIYSQDSKDSSISDKSRSKRGSGKNEEERAAAAEEPFFRSRSAMASLSSIRQQSNLASYLSEKAELEIQKHVQEKVREREEKLRKSFLARKPAWKALRTSARYDHERDLKLRNKLRQSEAREQAERHRIQMEMMLDRVTQIPALFERYSQNYRENFQLYSKLKMRNGMQQPIRKDSMNKKHRQYRKYSPRESSSSPRPNSGSPLSSSVTSSGHHPSSKSSGESSRKILIRKLDDNVRNAKKRGGERGALKVSINETAEFIQDDYYNIHETTCVDQNDIISFHDTC